EALGRARIDAAVEGDELERNLAPAQQMPRAIDGTHAARRDAIDDRIALTNDLADLGHGRRIPAADHLDLVVVVDRDGNVYVRPNFRVHVDVAVAVKVEMNQRAR